MPLSSANRSLAQTGLRQAKAQPEAGREHPHVDLTCGISSSESGISKYTPTCYTRPSRNVQCKSRGDVAGRVSTPGSSSSSLQHFTSVAHQSPVIILNPSSTRDSSQVIDERRLCVETVDDGLVMCRAPSGSGGGVGLRSLYVRLHCEVCESKEIRTVPFSVKNQSDD